MSKVEYKNTLIKDIGRVVTGKTPETKKAEFYGNGYMFITPAELHDGYNVQVSDKYITESGLQSIKSNCIDGTSVMVGCIGWDMGNVAICHRKCATNQQINSITDFNPKYNPFYTYYWLLTKKDYLFTIASVTRTPILSKSTFEEIVIPMPDRSIQDNVVGTLKPIDDMMENNKRICSELEAMAKTLYDYWFVQFDFPDENGEPYRTAGGEMVWNEQLKREIPKGWEFKKIFDICEIISGYPFQSSTYSKTGKYRLITIKNVQDSGIDLNVDNYVKDLPGNLPDYCILSPGDILMSLTGNVGRVGIMYADECLLNQRVALIKPKHSYLNVFLYFLFKSNRIKILMENISTGTSQKNLSPVDTGNLIIPFNGKIVKMFCDKLESVIAKIVIAEKEKNELAKFRDWLLPMLMNGQARVE